jgi:hypothetical protein
MAISFEPAEVLKQCVNYGPVVGQPAGLVGSQLMASIAIVESTLGRNCGPRYEESYDVGGRNVNPEQSALLKRYLKRAACSYGPWQLMLVNCQDYSPDELNIDVEINARCFVSYFHSYVMHHNPVNLAQIGHVYNGGHIYSDPVPAQIQTYVNRLQTAYDTVQVPKQ